MKNKHLVDQIVEDNGNTKLDDDEGNQSDNFSPATMKIIQDQQRKSNKEKLEEVLMQKAPKMKINSKPVKK